MKAKTNSKYDSFVLYEKVIANKRWQMLANVLLIFILAINIFNAGKLLNLLGLN